MPSSMKQVARCMFIVLVLTSAAVAVSAQEEDDVDRTDFTEEHLKEDTVKEATASHSDIEPTWIFPESPDSKLPVGGTTDLLVALANSGVKMFNVSHVEGELRDAAGKVALKLARFEYGQPLGPLEQRSFRFPIMLDAEMAMGEYSLSSKIFYNTRDKEPYVTVVCNQEAVEVVPALPSFDAQVRMLQMCLGVAGVLVMVLLAVWSAMPAADAKGKASKKAKATSDEAPAAVSANEWLSGTLAGSESRSSKKGKKKA